VIALTYLASRQRTLPLLSLKRRTEVTAIYWHFMDGLWLYLALLLFVWR
jgi:heme/copper-type cytochrome/quinol oxidase subunit 3